jgi:SPP1 family predicted phage head-tail adaptor
MRAGKLRNRVTIEQRVAGSPPQSASGEPDESWTAYATVQASIDPLRGRELYAAQEHHSEVDVKIRMRLMAGVNDGVTAAMRVVDGSTVYNIKAVLIDVNFTREITLMCATGLNNG